MAQETNKYIEYIRSSTQIAAIQSLQSLVGSLDQDLLVQVATLADKEAQKRKKLEVERTKRRSQSDPAQVRGLNGSTSKKHKPQKDLDGEEVNPLEKLLGEQLSPIKKIDAFTVTKNDQYDVFDDEFEMNSEEDRFAILATSGITFTENGDVEDNSSDRTTEIVPQLKPLEEMIKESLSQEFSKAPIFRNGDLENVAQPMGFMKASGKEVEIKQGLLKAQSIFKGIEKDLEKMVEL